MVERVTQIESKESLETYSNEYTVIIKRHIFCILRISKKGISDALQIYSQHVSEYGDTIFLQNSVEKFE